MTCAIWSTPACIWKVGLPLALPAEGVWPLADCADPAQTCGFAWHDRFRADGLGTDIAALLTRAVRVQRGREPKPTTAIPAKPIGLRRDSQSVPSGPQAGLRGVDGNKKVRGIKRHVLTCLLSFVLATLVTAANVHDTRPVGALLERAAQDGTFARVACGSGALPGLRASSRSNPSTPSSANRRCQRHADGRLAPLRAATASTVSRSADRRMVLARWTCLCGRLRSATTAAKRSRPAELTMGLTA